MRSTTRRLAIVGVLAASVVTAFVLVKTRPKAKRKPPPERVTLVTVQTVRPSPKVPVRVSAFGTVIPAQSVELQPEVSGRVIYSSPSLVPGGFVKAGEPLFRIDAREYRLAARQAQATVKRAEFDLTIERSRRRIAEREWKLLGDERNASEEGRSLALREPHLANAKAALESAQSGLARARLSVARTTLEAPFNAFVKSESVDVGQVVTPQVRVASLVGTDTFWVQVSIPVSSLPWIDIPGVGGEQGSEVRVLQEIGGQSRIGRRGRVLRLMGDLDPKGRMARVLVSIDDPFRLKGNEGAVSMPLLLGAYVRVEIDGKALEDAFVVPRVAVHDDGRVWIMAPDGTLQSREISIARRDREVCYVTGGLKAGDRIVTSRIPAPVVGMKLRTVDQPAPGEVEVSKAQEPIESPATVKDGEQREGSPMTTAAKGAIAWMAKHGVAANLAMAVLMIGGLMMAFQVKQEVFPEFELDIVQIGVPYPGASPAEVEQGIILAIEEGVRGLDGVKRITASANENIAGVSVELLLGTDANKALADVKNAVDRITTFPEDAERPVVNLITNRQPVVSVVVHGRETEEVLRQVADRVRDELVQDPGITYVELEGVRPREISVELSQANLRRYDLTLDGVARSIAQQAVELPGGGVKTAGGEVLLRTTERRDYGTEFGDLSLLTAPDGTQLKVRDVADVVDGFADTDQAASFNDEPAVMVKVYRTGEQTPIDVSDAVQRHLRDAKGLLPPGVKVALLDDRSEMYRERMNLLLRNAGLGLILVLGILGLFLEVRLAFWVTMGIPISFLGSLLLMPAMDVSINMVSLFAFIVTLGIVVDDAIVVGENIFHERQKGTGFLEAAVKGAREIARPVVFSVLTTIAAFLPLFLVPGTMGKIFRVIPSIVVCVLAISLFESLFILPAHLGHSKPGSRGRLIRAIDRLQQRFERGLRWWIGATYRPTIRAALANRYLTLTLAVGILLVTLAVVVSGRINFTFMPKVDSDTVSASATLPFGISVRETERVRARLMKAAREVLAESGGEDIARGVYSDIGSRLARRGPAASASGGGAGHLTNTYVFLVPSGERDITAEEFARKWREKAADIIGLEALSFRFSTGPGAGASLNIELNHPDIEVLEAASGELAAALSTFAGVKDVDDGFSAGKPQLDFTIKPEAQSLGLTSFDVGRQVRAAFFGAEALRQQRGRDEVRVMVRLPEAERRSLFDVEEMLIRSPDGGDVPLSVAADVALGRSYTTISRADGRRVVTVSGDTVRGVANADKVLDSMALDVIPDLQAKYAGLGYSFEGDRRHRSESMESLKSNFVFALIIIFGLLAIPFRSYAQPLVVMSAIPFGIVGAVAGHMVMGYDLSLISMMGIVAASGIVVNDSLVLVDAANQERADGASPFESIVRAGQRRFRPILLTSLTTFFGLAPMIFETSVQARFLIPMAISLGFGVLFSTFIILIIVPALYLIVEDVKSGVAATSSSAAEPQSSTN